MRDKERFLNRLAEELNSREQAQAVYALIELWQKEEAEYRRECQKEGIKKAKMDGVPFGRPKIQGPDNFRNICEQFIDGKITADSGARLCQMGLSTFYRRVRDYRDQVMEEKKICQRG